LRQPLCPIGGVQLWISFFRQDQTISSIRTPHGGLLLTIAETLKGIFANSLQHPKTWLGFGPVHTLNQILIYQG
jgi:hypothetical protein